MRHSMCFGRGKRNDMKTDSPQKKPSLNLTSIFRCMMEEGYYPVFEQSYIQFEMDGNLAVVEYEDGIASLRLFFSIDTEECGLFMEASNISMASTYSVKPVVLDDRENIMFCCEFFCDNLREFRKFFPRAINMMEEALAAHRAEIKKLVLAQEAAAKTIPATEESMTGRRKIFS